MKNTTLKHEIRKLFWKIGIDIIRYKPIPDELVRRKYLFNTYNIDVLLDVGANNGWWSKQVRDVMGYKEKIISFEPLSSAFELLKENSKGDSNWQIHNFGLGDIENNTKINISENSFSSSLLNMTSTHLEVSPDSKYSNHQEVKIKTLDSIFDKICNKNNNIYLKIDTQGFEDKVLKGAENSLSFIDTIQLEMSLVSLYEGELLFDEMYNYLLEKGYTLVAIEIGFSDERTGQLLQFDGIFHRN